MKLFTTYDVNTKNNLRNEINHLENKLIIESLKEEFNNIKTKISSLKNQLDLRSSEEKEELIDLEMIKSDIEEIMKDEKKLDEYKSKNLFLWHLRFIEVFDEKDGFDIVIANPPYVSFGLRGVSKANKSWIKNLRLLYPNSAEYKLSLYGIFMDLGLQLLREGGILAYITPDSFLLGRYFSKLRKLILDICRIMEILMFEKDFWESGIVGRPVISLLEKKLNIDSKKNNISTYKLYHSLDDFNKNLVRIFSYSQTYFKKNSFNRFRLFFDEKQKLIADKLQMNSKPLSNFMNFASGLIGKNGKDQIISNENKGPNWHPGLISGSEIEKYVINYKGNYILFDNKILKSGFKDAKYFEPKILLRQTGDSLIAAFDDQNLLCLNNLHVGNLKSKKYDIKYILALLNSTLLNYYYHLISLEVGRVMAQIDIETLEELPIKECPDNIVKAIVDLVDKIIYESKKGNKNNMKEYEKKIDNLVYKLYDLTPEEIKFIENGAK